MKAEEVGDLFDRQAARLAVRDELEVGEAPGSGSDVLVPPVGDGGVHDDDLESAAGMDASSREPGAST
jgi:hypothetical protein